MARALFLFNHDSAHQVAHLAPIAGALAEEHPHVTTQIAYSSGQIRDRIESLIEPKIMERIEWHELSLSGVTGYVTQYLDRILPASRLARLRKHEGVLSQSDAVISTERTCLRVADRLDGTRIPLFIRVPHGTGDRSVTFHPDHRRFDLSLVAGPKMKRQLIEHGIAPEKILVTGYAKFEQIDLNSKPNYFDNERPTFVYNPHFDPHLSSWYTMGPDVLRWFASKSGQSYNLIFAPHVMLFRKSVHVSPEYKIAKSRPDIPAEIAHADNILIDVDGPSLFDMSYMLAADAYIGDASSQLYEFLVRPRPVILLDQEGWLQDQGQACLPFLETGPAVRNISEMQRAVSDHASLAERYRDVQRTLIADTFAFGKTPPSSRGARAIADAITKRKLGK